MPKQKSAKRLAFEEFHATNPWVYRGLAKLARQMKEKGQPVVSIWLIMNVLRWQTMLKTTSKDGWKINNNHAAFYARLLMANEDDLRGFFPIRVLKGEG